MLRTSCKSLIFNDGKFRFRNWSRGRLSPLASIEIAAGLMGWEVEALDDREVTDVMGGGMAEVVGRVRGVIAEGGGKLVPLAEEGRERRDEGRADATLGAAPAVEKVGIGGARVEAVVERYVGGSSKDVAGVVT